MMNQMDKGFHDTEKSDLKAKFIQIRLCMLCSNKVGYDKVSTPLSTLCNLTVTVRKKNKIQFRSPELSCIPMVS